jgi:hypothetical protein
MNKNTISIEIHQPVEKVFEFTVNPANTPKWLECIVEEHRSDDIVKVGTIYTNTTAGNGKQKETEYKVIGYEPNRLFQLQCTANDYTCTYLYETINGGMRTKLTYIEEVAPNNILADPLDAESFNTLKRLLETE